MSDPTDPLRVVSIAHPAISREAGRLRYYPLADRADLELDLVVPARWHQFGRVLSADPADDPVRVHVEPIRLPQAGPMGWYLHFYPGLRRLLRRTRADVVHLWEEPWSVVALQACLLKGRAALVLEVDQNILKTLPPPFEAMRRFVLARTDHILSRSPDATAVVRAGGYAGPVTMIGYGVDETRFRPAETPPPAHAGLRIGYVGRIIEEKGLDEALEAMARAASPVSLAIMGEGPYEGEVRRRAFELGLADRVTIRGWGSPAEVAPFIHGLDALVLLTRTTQAVREQFGRVITEAQACGVPVIGSECGAIPSVVGPGGWIVPERDPAALARLLDAIAADPADRAARGAAGWRNVAQRFTYDAVAQSLVQAWTQAAAARRGGGCAGCVPTRPGHSDEAPPAMTPEIVQVVQEFSTAGGAETVAFELARAFANVGVPNCVLASVARGRIEPATRVETVAGWVGRIPLRGSLRYLARIGVTPLFTLAATLALRRHRNAVVVSHGDTLRGDILVVHAVNAASLAEKRRGGAWRWRFNPMHVWVGLRDRLMIGGLRYRTYVAVSDRVSTELQQHYRVPEDRIRVIPNGIDLARFRREPEAGRAIRREFGIPPQARLLVFAGHEFARKGLAHVIGALERMPADTWLLVVGSDNPAPYRRLAQTVAGRLVFAGHRADMPAIYAAADAFVLPTAYETFSLVCMEAMACGLPVFATRVGGIEDYLVDGQSGYGILAEPADIADKLSLAFADPALMARLGAGARETASRFGWDRVAQTYLGLIAEVRAAKCAGAPAAPAVASRPQPSL